MTSRKSKHSDMSRYSLGGPVARAQSTLSVSAVDYLMQLPVARPPSPSQSTITLTPGRVRNIDQDMEALRESRQDNPFLQQIIASRESLVDFTDDVDSDDTNLMAQEFPIDLNIDPLTLPEMHEHMIRSPPPTTWPRSPNYKVFQFPMEDEESVKEKEKHKTKHGRSLLSEDSSSPLRSSSVPRYGHHHERFSLLSSGGIRSQAEDSIQLMSTED